MSETPSRARARRAPGAARRWVLHFGIPHLRPRGQHSAHPRTVGAGWGTPVRPAQVRASVSEGRGAGGRPRAGCDRERVFQLATGSRGLTSIACRLVTEGAREAKGGRMTVANRTTPHRFMRGGTSRTRRQAVVTGSQSVCSSQFQTDL